MSNELERRLERALGEAPGPTPGPRTGRSGPRSRRCRRRARLRTRCGGVGSPSSWPRAWQRSSRWRHARGDERPSAGRRLGASTDLPPPRSGFAPAAGYLDLGRQQAGALWPSPQVPERRLAGRELTAFAASPGSLYLVEGHGRRLRAVDADRPRGVDTERSGRPAHRGRLVAVSDSDRLRPPNPRGLHRRRSLGHGNASVHRRPRRGARDARLAVGLEGAGLRDGIRGGRRP